MRMAASIFVGCLLALSFFSVGNSINYADIIRDNLNFNTTVDSSITESLLETRASSESYEDALIIDEDVDKDGLDNESISFLPSQSIQQPIVPSSESLISTSTLKKMEALTELFNNASHSGSSLGGISSAVGGGLTHSGRMSTKFLVTSSSSSSEFKEPGEEVTSLREEEEGVLSGTRKTIPMPKSIFQKSIEWMGDAYTMSIMLPIAAGVLFAATIIVGIAFCRCIRRRCRRRRLRRKTLPDSVKNLRPSDRARLLAESSDDEF